MLIILAGVPAVAARGQDAPPPPPGGAAFSTFGYGDTDLKGQVGEAELFFPLSPDTRAAGDTAIELDVSHSPLLRDSSTLTVLAGGVSVTSIALTPDTASHRRVPVTVPAGLFRPDGLPLSLRTYLRLSDDACEDPANPALWATVHAGSSVRLGTEPAARALDDVRRLLLGPAGTKAVDIALPPSPDPEILGAAGVVAAEVGQWQAQRHTDALVGLAGSASTAGIVIAAGAATPAGFPVAWTGSGFQGGGADTPGDRGLLALTQDGPAQLLVGGSTPAAVARAAAALPTVSGGSLAVLTGERPAPPSDAALPWRDGAASLAQLGVERQQVTGPGRHAISVALERPPGWRIEGHPTLDLVVDTPPTIVPDRSSVQVAVAGVDVGTRPIQGGSGPHTYSFDIPAGLIDRRLDGSPVRGLDLKVAVQLEPVAERCQAADPGSAWAALLPTSTFRLPHGDAGRRDVGRFPYPAASGNAGAAVVLPRAPSTDAVAAGIQLCAAIGRWSAADAPTPLLVTSDRLAAADKDRRGLVLVGDADAEVLGQSVDLGRPPVAPPAGRPTALVGVVASPLDHDRSVFVVHGDGPGLVLAARTLSSRQSVDELRGSRVSLVAGAPSVTLAGPEAVPSAPPELAPALDGRSHVSRKSWAFPALVLLAGFLAGLFLVAWYRWGPGRRRRRS